MSIEIVPPRQVEYQHGPNDIGMIAWTYDPMHVSTSGGLTSGRIQYQKVHVTAAAVVTGAVLSVQTVGSTLTAGQSLMGLYNEAGTRLAVTADQSASWAGSTGVKQCAFTSTVTVGPGSYFVAFICVGTTPVTLHRYSASAVTVNGFLTTVSTLRSRRSSGVGNTSLPASVAWDSDCILDGSMHWVGLY